MNKTYPKDGKQHRQSQNYVPTGPIYSRRFYLWSNIADAKRIYEKYGSLTVLSSSARYRYTSKNGPYNKTRQRNEIRSFRQVNRTATNEQFLKVDFSSDAIGHSLAVDELTKNELALNAGASCRIEEDDDDEPKQTNRPPIVKRLTGKERKIAKKRAVNEQDNSERRQED